tara:strand:- start:30 stop:443 length:414 start_codon:yes stop_codon:yes gene_type:complete
MASIIETQKDKTIILVIVIPLIIFGYAMFSPHLTDVGHIAHIVIHEAGFLIAGFLLSLTIIAYFKTKLPRMLFSAAAFSVLTFAQGVYLFLEQNTKPDHHVDFLSANEIFDTSIVIMTILFALGVFYNSRTKQYFKI